MIVKISSEKFQVPSSSRHGQFHTITRLKSNIGKIGNEWECSCEAFAYRKKATDICKHIIEVKMQLRKEALNV